MENIKNFQFIYHNKWEENLLLSKFRKCILKDPLLFSNNNFKNVKPIKEMTSFANLHEYIQAFNFKDENYPVYYGIAFALQHSYVCNKAFKENFIYFKAIWEIDTGNHYFRINQLPKNYEIYWIDFSENNATFTQLYKKYYEKN